MDGCSFIHYIYRSILSLLYYVQSKKKSNFTNETVLFLRLQFRLYTLPKQQLRSKNDWDS